MWASIMSTADYAKTAYTGPSGSHEELLTRLVNEIFRSPAAGMGPQASLGGPGLGGFGASPGAVTTGAPKPLFEPQATHTAMPAAPSAESTLAQLALPVSPTPSHAGPSAGGAGVSPGAVIDGSAEARACRHADGIAPGGGADRSARPACRFGTWRAGLHRSELGWHRHQSRNCDDLGAGRRSAVAERDKGRRAAERPGIAGRCSAWTGDSRRDISAGAPLAVDCQSLECGAPVVVLRLALVILFPRRGARRPARRPGAAHRSGQKRADAGIPVGASRLRRQSGAARLPDPATRRSTAGR